MFSDIAVYGIMGVFTIVPLGPCPPALLGSKIFYKFNISKIDTRSGFVSL